MCTDAEIVIIMKRNALIDKVGNRPQRHRFGAHRDNVVVGYVGENTVGYGAKVE